MNHYKTLGSVFANIGIRSAKIIAAGGHFILKINNRFAGKYKTYAGAQEILDSIAGRGGPKNQALDAITWTNETAVKRATDLNRRFGVIKYISNPSGAEPNWDGWSPSTISFYVGQPIVGTGQGWQGARAFGANINPTSVNFSTQWNADPTNLTGAFATSPWHNILYEHLVEDYRYGVRSFLLYMPFGAYGPTTGIWLCSPIQQEDTFTQPASGNYWQSPARWKGFWEATKQLLDGTFPAPTAVDPATRPQFTDPVDITIYFNGCCSYKTYRDELFAVYNGAGGGAAGDAAVKSLLDRFIARVVSMKPAPNKGILTCIFDVSSLSASPHNLKLWRTLDDPPANGDRAAQSYISDFCELADYYVATAIESAGIQVRCESRAVPYSDEAQVTDEQSPFGTTSPTADRPLYNYWGPSAGDAAWMLTVEPSLNPDPAFPFISSQNLPHTVLLQGSFLANEDKVRYGYRSKVFNGASVRDLFLNPSPGHATVYSPHYAMQHLYIIADLLQDTFMRRGDKTRKWKERRIFKSIATYFVDTYALCGQLMPFNHFADAVPGPANKNSTQARYVWYHGNVNFMPTTWNLATFQANPATYSLGYWTPATKAFFDVNIRGYDAGGSGLILFNWEDWLGNIHATLNMSAKPPGATGPAPVWGTDDWYVNCIDAQMRTP